MTTRTMAMNSRNTPRSDPPIWSVDHGKSASYIGSVTKEFPMATPALPLQDLSDALAGIVLRAAPSVVAVRCARAQSSGFVWRPGLIVTADEALDDEGGIAVALPGGAPAAATLVGRDPTTDVALLRIEDASAPPLALQ